MKREPLLMWTVYWSPQEYPGKFVARKWLVTDRPESTDNVFVASDLDGVRALLPGGLYRMPASPGDNPAVVETWL